MVVILLMGWFNHSNTRIAVALNMAHSVISLMNYVENHYLWNRRYGIRLTSHQFTIKKQCFRYGISISSISWERDIPTTCHLCVEKLWKYATARKCLNVFPAIESVVAALATHFMWFGHIFCHPKRYLPQKCCATSRSLTIDFGVR